MKKILLATGFALLMSANAFAQATATVDAAEAVLNGATRTAPKVGAPVRTGRTARPAQAKTARPAVGTATATGVTAGAAVSMTNKSTQTAAVAPGAGVAVCQADILALQAAKRSVGSDDYKASATCGENVSPAGQRVEVSILQAMDKVSSPAAKATAGATALRAARGNISMDEARASLKAVGCPSAAKPVPCLSLADSVCAAL